MSEYQEVMKNWKRMCAKQANCRDCPLKDTACWASCPGYFDDDSFCQIEKTVTIWAATHPEPVYPTWGEWLLEQGVIKAGTETRGGFTYQCVSDKLFNPIPDDTAKRLGLEPKEE